MRELRMQGLGIMAIARKLGRTHAVVCRHLDPDQMELQRQLSRASREKPGAAERDKQYRQNPETRARKVVYLAEYQRRDEVRAYQLSHQRSPESRAVRAALKRKTYQESPQERITQNMRGRLRYALAAARAGRAAPAVELLGMDPMDWLYMQPEDLREAWLAGEDIHIDEIRPCATFWLEDPEQQRCCFNWRNRQLLPGFVNVSKRANFDPVHWARRMRVLGWTGPLFLEDRRQVA